MLVLLTFGGGGGGVVQNRESPDFRSLAKTKPYTTIPCLDKIFNQLISFLKNDTLF